MAWIALAILLCFFLWKWPRPTLIIGGCLGAVGLVAVAVLMGPDIYKKRQREKDRAFVSYTVEYTGTGFVERIANTSDRVMDEITATLSFSRKEHSSAIASTAVRSDRIVPPGGFVETEHIFLQIGENTIIPDDGSTVFSKARHTPEIVFETSKRYLGKCLGTADVVTEEDKAAFAESMYAMTPADVAKKCRRVYLYSAVTVRTAVESVVLR